MDSSTALRVFGVALPNYLLVAASSWLSRIIITFVAFSSIRLLSTALGIEGYALYSLLIGLLPIFTLSDMGLGQSMQNLISESRAKSQLYHEIIIATFFILIISSIGAIALALAVCLLFSSALFEQFNFLSSNEKFYNFISIAVIAITTSSGSFVYKLWYAEQRGYLSNLVQSIASLLGLGLAYILAIQINEHGILWYVILVNLPQAILPMTAYLQRVIESWRQHPKVHLSTCVHIGRRAINFWLFNLIAVAVLHLDYVVLSQYVSQKDIIVYSVATKIFNVGIILYTGFLLALWPVFTELKTKNSHHEIKRLVRKLALFILGFAFAFTISFVVIRDFLVEFLLPNQDVRIPIPFILLLGGGLLIRAWSDINAVVLQSISDVKTLLMWATVQAMLSVGLQIVLAPKLGIYGIVMGISTSFLLTVGWALPIRLARLLR